MLLADCGDVIESEQVGGDVGIGGRQLTAGNVGGGIGADIGNYVARSPQGA
jgi:hypothetical protein